MITKNYMVTVNFCGFMNCEEEYEVYAESEVEAETEALNLAEEDLMITYVEELEDGSYEVGVQWIFVGCEESYVVEADNEDEAESLAIEEAISDLEVVDIVDG